mmetsp:Transcript_39620/g.93229  ORF Transcript_39620/g.93229 Transcript_39620/m.93229 type:complete len:203 (-) Transcript_39620:2132-2740(-)
MCRDRSSSMSAAFPATVSSLLSWQAFQRNSMPCNCPGRANVRISYARILTLSSSSSRCQSCRSVQSCVSSLPVSSQRTVCRCEGMVCHFSGSNAQIVPLCIFSSFQSTRTLRPTKAAPLILQPDLIPSRPDTTIASECEFTSPKNAWKQLKPWGRRRAGSIVHRCCSNRYRWTFSSKIPPESAASRSHRRHASVEPPSASQR